jgi:hypothetical protein
LRKVKTVSAAVIALAVVGLAFSACSQPVATAEKTPNALAAVTGAVTLPDAGVTVIGINAYKDRNDLESVTIRDGVTVIGPHAFDNCSKMKSVVIPSSVRTIYDWAFYSCDSLESVVIPEGVIEIGDAAFCDCSKLKSVVIANSVRILDSRAFYQCYSLVSITIGEGYSVNTSNIYSGVFAECPGDFRAAYLAAHRAAGTYVYSKDKGWQKQ